MRDFVRMPPQARRKPPAAEHRPATKTPRPNAGFAAERTGQIVRRPEISPAHPSRDLWRAATAGSAAPLPHRGTMERLFGRAFSGVRAYFGRSAPLNALGANAATDGERVAFASHAPSRRQVAHELAHVVQMRQGGGTADGSRLSRPGSPAEREADRVAERAGRGEPVAVAEAAPAALHRDIKEDNLKVPHGHFKIDMTSLEVEGDWSGLTGTIHYTPNDKAPDSDSIRLSQVIKNTRVNTGADVDIKKIAEMENIAEMQTVAGERIHNTVKGETLNSVSTAHFGSNNQAKQIGSDNEKLIRAAAPGALTDTTQPLPASLALKIAGAVTKGYSIDHEPSNKNAKVRTKLADPVVPQDYVWPGEEVEKENQHGSKKGKVIKEAVLSDGPSTKKSHLKWQFETVARSEDIGVYYGTIWWEFEVNGSVSPPKVGKEAHGVRPGVSDTFRSALTEFNRFYANPHTVMQGQTLWEISRLYFGTPDRANDIFNENKKLMGTRDGPLKAGWVLRIPDVTDTLKP